MFRIPRSPPKLPFPERRKSLNMNKETVSKKNIRNNKKKQKYYHLFSSIL